MGKSYQRIDGRLQSEEDRKAKWTRRLGPFAPIALFLLKIKSAIFLLAGPLFASNTPARWLVYCCPQICCPVLLVPEANKVRSKNETM